jgi:2-keto-4-pentenoate hydratase
MAETAVDVFVAARRSLAWIDALPEAVKPATLEDAHAIQDATAVALGEAVAGWKVAIGSGVVMRGVILSSVVQASPARVEAKRVPLLGMEGEIAFQFDQALPPRAEAYTRAEIEAAVTAHVVIEIVASRFVSYAGTPLLDRTADCMSNGAFIVGTRRADWREVDLAGLETVLEINGVEVVRIVGGHPTKDPLLPAIALVNELCGSTGVAVGQFITTGTYTGMPYAKPGDQVTVRFTGFGEASVTLVA